MQWTGNQSSIRDDEGRQVEVQVQHECPMVSLMDGRQILQWLEGYQVHQLRKIGNGANLSQET